jgi:hypothetical protein
VQEDFSVAIAQSDFFLIRFHKLLHEEAPLVDNTPKSVLNMAVMVIAVILYIFKNN